jgi:hypothetical protein
VHLRPCQEVALSQSLTLKLNLIAGDSEAKESRVICGNSILGAGRQRREPQSSAVLLLTVRQLHVNCLEVFGTEAELAVAQAPICG